MSYFERKTRDDGESFVCCKDDAPEWVKDACQEAHHGTFPDDWIYQEIEAAFDAYDDREGRPDDHEHADGRVDIYTKQVFAWAEDMCHTDLYSYAEAEAEELGDGGTTCEQIQRVQYCAIQMIACTIWDAIEAHAEEDDNESDDA